MTERTSGKKTKRLLILYAAVSISVLVAGTALVVGHLKYVQAGDGYKGVLIPIELAFDLSFVIAITSVAFCAGRRIARLLSLNFTGAAEELAFSVMMGVGVIGLGLLVLGLAGLLVPVPIILFIALLILLSWRDVLRLMTLVKDSSCRSLSTKLRVALVLSFAALIVILASRTLTPPHTPDEAIYHLSVTKRFVQQGRISPVIDNWAGNMPFLIHMLYAICLVAKADIAAKLFGFCLAVVTSLAVYAFCCRFLTRRAGVASMFGFFGAGMVVEVAITSRIDVSLAGMLFLAAYAMMVYFQTSAHGWLCASAILSGFSLGIKYSAGIYIILISIMFLVESFFRRQKVVHVIRRGLLYSAIVAAIAAPWFVKNFVWFSNPVYPFVTGEVAEYAPGRIRFFDAEDQHKLDAHFENARAQMPGLVNEREVEMSKAAAKRVKRQPLRFWEYFTKPDIYNMSEEYHYPNYLFLFCPLMVFVARSRWLVWLGLFSVAFFLASVETSWIARLLLPIYPALTVISAYTICELASKSDWRARSRRLISMSRLIPVLVATAVVGGTALFSIVRFRESKDVSFITGAVSGTEYMQNVYYYAPADFINRATPENSRVLMIGAEASYDLQRDYIADVNWDSTEWRRLLVRNRSLEDLNADLKSRGVTHVWVAYGLFTFVAEMGRENYPNVSGPIRESGPDYQAQLTNWATLDTYSTRFLEAIYNDQFGNIVYRIR
jgi:4-amino-4-deoxy-L-arabinose transferase-like glycosyltransferase